MEKVFGKSLKTKVLRSSCHYNIRKSTLGGYYTFTTKNGIVYRCSFSKHDDQILGLSVKSPVYTFLLLKKKSDANEVFDRNIGMTVSEILNRFFDKNPKAILSYICDNLDKKGIKRQKSFEKWFSINNRDPKKALIKFEITNVIYSGAILLNSNREIIKIETYFKKEIKEYTESNKQANIETVR